VGFLDALDRSIAPVVQGLSYRSDRHAAIASNIANADTPGYRAMDVSFSGTLRQAGLRLAATHPRHRTAAAPQAGGDRVVLTGGEQRRDGNDVNVDREMAHLARNQIEYQFLTRALGGRFRKLKEAITGRASA